MSSLDSTLSSPRMVLERAFPLPSLKAHADPRSPTSLFKSLPSLWGRQIPYTMMKFWSFEVRSSARIVRKAAH